MNPISWLSSFLRGSDERKMTSEELFQEIYGGRESATGISVNASRALEVATVLACCRVIANGIAQVPWKLFRDDGRTRSVANDHPVSPLIYRRPNPRQTSFAFRETLALHVLLTGNAYVWKGMVGSARQIRELNLLDPMRMRVEEDGDRLRYVQRMETGERVEFSEDVIWHVRGPSWNGWAGLDAVNLARDAIGLSIATEMAHAEFHRNGAKVSGAYSVDGPLSAERMKQLAAWLDMHTTGGGRAHKPLILDNGAKWMPQSMTGVDAQHLETRKHQIEEICRAFGVLPIMVAHADKTATYASAEQMFLAHVVHTLSPWYERLEQSADVSLLTEEERAAGLYTKFLPNGLMRGAAQDRASFYQAALGAGGHGTAWMTTNEVRALEELDAIEGGDVLPSLEPATAPAETPDTPEEDDEGDDASN